MRSTAKPMAKLSPSMMKALHALVRYLKDPMGSRINLAYNRSKRTYTDKADHCYTEWFPASVAARVVPDNFSLQRCWTNTVAALLRRGLVEWRGYDWELRGEPMRGRGLTLTEAGRDALAAEAQRVLDSGDPAAVRRYLQS